MKWTYLIALIFIGLGCRETSKSTSDNVRKLNGSSYVVVDSGSLAHDSNAVSGQGSLVFLDPVKEKDNNYSLNFLLEDGGFFKLVANGENKLNGGVSVKFARSAAKLTVTLSSDDKDEDISSFFTAVDATSELAFHVDVHNGESPAHVLIWPGDTTVFSEASALFNSEEDTETPGQGGGSLWGVELSKAVLKSAVTSEPKFED